MDIIWGLMRFSVIITWFVGAGAVALLLMYFKPTARLFKKYFSL